MIEKGELATSIKERKKERTKKSKNKVHQFGPCWE